MDSEIRSVSLCSDFWNAHNNPNIVLQCLDEVGNIIYIY
jgi:hypothetical protein